MLNRSKKLDINYAVVALMLHIFSITGYYVKSKEVLALCACGSASYAACNVPTFNHTRSIQSTTVFFYIQSAYLFFFFLMGNHSNKREKNESSADTESMMMVSWEVREQMFVIFCSPCPAAACGKRKSVRSLCYITSVTAVCIRLQWSE